MDTHHDRITNDSENRKSRPTGAATEETTTVFKEVPSASATRMGNPASITPTSELVVPGELVTETQSCTPLVWRSFTSITAARSCVAEVSPRSARPRHR